MKLNKVKVTKIGNVTRKTHYLHARKERMLQVAVPAALLTNVKTKLKRSGKRWPDLILPVLHKFVA